MRIQKLFEAINQELVDNKLQHVQALFRLKDGRRCIKFVSVDNDQYKARVKAIADRYCESLYLIDETKTTLTYAI